MREPTSTTHGAPTEGDASGWNAIYRDLIEGGVDAETQRQGTAWLDHVLPLLPAREPGRALDLGCGLGADMLRLRLEGFTPVGLDAEPRAVDFVKRSYGLEAYRCDFAAALPFLDAHFRLVISRFAMHFLDDAAARRLFQEVRRVLEPDGLLAFVVNSDEHRRRGLQYDYRGAREVAPGTWHLPTIGRTYRFYTPGMARDALGDGWELLELRVGEFDHWGIVKHALTCVARPAC
ncbi:MAG: class I SAM-dependent methyltransferase [Trueperaceae bacterium]